LFRHSSEVHPVGTRLKWGILHGNGRWRIQWDAGILKMHAIDENLGINHDNGGMALFGYG
jgi:hypothetical protein